MNITIIIQADHCLRSMGNHPRTIIERLLMSEMSKSIQRIRDGETAAAIARELGIKPSTFNARLRNRGLPVRGLQSGLQ